MGDHRDLAAIFQEVGLGAKRGATLVEAYLAFRRDAPPKFLEIGKIEIRPERCQLSRRGALVAGEDAALPDQRLDGDRHAERLADDGRGLQGAPVGARYQ